MSSPSADPVRLVTVIHQIIADPAVPQVTGENIADLADPAETENNNR